nr:hypothetical protein [Candidatus Freyarchaeota archaeon]
MPLLHFKAQRFFMDAHQEKGAEAVNRAVTRPTLLTLTVEV